MDGTAAESKKKIAFEFGDLTEKNKRQVQIILRLCESREVEEKTLLEWVKTPETVRLCYHSEILVGVLVLQIESKEHKRVALKHLCVLPAYRRFGFGSEMLKAASDFAKQKSQATLVVRVQSENQSALSFYQNRGFVAKEQPIADYFPSLTPSSAVELEKKIEA